MTNRPDEAFPGRLRIRDTRLYDDMGGAGQRIYTTAGQGYKKVEYVRADLYDAQAAEIEKLYTTNTRFGDVIASQAAEIAALKAEVASQTLVTDRLRVSWRGNLPPR